MLGLVLIYWIGKYFYKLADEFDKSKWGFAILGVVVYYSGALILGGVTLGIIEVFSEGFIDSSNNFFLSLIAMPFGILSCYILYNLLNKKWKKETPKADVLIDQIGKEE